MVIANKPYVYKSEYAERRIHSIRGIPDSMLLTNARELAEDIAEIRRERAGLLLICKEMEGLLEEVRAEHRRRVQVRREVGMSPQKAAERRQVERRRLRP